MLTFSNLFPNTTSSLILNSLSNENNKNNEKNKKKKQRHRLSRISISSTSSMTWLSSSSSSSSPSSSTTTLPKTTVKTKIDALPSEILLLILNNLAAPDLINISSSNSYFFHLINQHHLLVHKLKDSTLRLFFRQESRWCCAIDMKLVRHNEKNRFIFKPVDQNTGFRMFSSKVLRDPSLYKITLDDQIVMPTKRATSLKIKETIAYRKSFDAMAVFCYSVHPTPSDWAKMRPGERWILPLLLECHPRWFMQHHGYTTTGKQLTHRMLEAFS